MKEAGIAVGDQQMALALFDWQGGQQGAIGSGGEHDAIAVQNGSVG